MSDHAIDTLAAHAWQAPSPTSYTIIFQLGGAIRQMGADASAFEDRQAHHALNINGVWSDPRATDVHIHMTLSRCRHRNAAFLGQTRHDVQAKRPARIRRPSGTITPV